MILPSQEIWRRKILDPYREQYRVGGVSGGASVASYDVMIDQTVILGPSGWKSFFYWLGSKFGICKYHKSFALASTFEHFTMPLDISAVVHDKSTWARLGVSLQNTYIDPGWKGWLTLELNNNTNDTIVIKEGMPIAQIVFTQLLRPAIHAYDGKYQNQERGPQKAR